MSDDVIVAGEDHQVALYIPYINGGYATSTDVVDITAKVYGLSGITYGNYSLKNASGLIKPIVEDSREFSFWIDKVSTTAALGDELRVDVTVTWSINGSNKDELFVNELPRVV